MSRAPRCAVASRERDEPLIGTASPVRIWLLLEDPGPWGIEPLGGSRLPADLASGVRAAAARAGRAKVALIRRHGRFAPRRRRCYVVSSDPRRPWVEHALLDDVRDVLDLDLAGAARSGSVGLPRWEGPLFLVCTHGRHDACCAIFGRPLAHAVSALHPEAAWECSHIGGDRFAGNLVCLPHGLYYGRVSAVDAVRITGSYARGRIDLAHLRGRSGWPTDVQVAELRVREHAGLLGVDDLALTAVRRDGPRSTVDLAARDGGGGWRVVLERRHGEPQRLTCTAARPSAAPCWDLLDLR